MIVSTTDGGQVADRLFEIQLGVYASKDDVTELADACAGLLYDHPFPHALSVVRHDQPGAAMPLAEDLPKQWRIEHPGEDAGPRAIHEIRVGLHTTRPRMDSLRDALARLICPDPHHKTPCAIPWATGYTDSADPGSAEEEQLKQRYGHLIPIT